MLSKDVEYAVEKLIGMGVLNEEALVRLAAIFRAIQSFGNPGWQNSPSEVQPEAAQAQEAQAPEEDEAEEQEHTDQVDDAEEEASPIQAPVLGGFQPGHTPKAAFDISKLELQGFHDVMSVKQIARLKQVSESTVKQKLKEFGLV